MRINWYPIAGLLLIVFIWLMIAAGGWLIWKTVLQPKVSSTVKVIEIERSFHVY